MRASLVSVCLHAAACSSLGSPPHELQALLQDRGEASSRYEAQARVKSARFTGEFKAVMVVSRGPNVRARVQLLPDFGGKVLDMTAIPSETKGYWPHTGEVFDGKGGLPQYLAISLLENIVPLTFDRVVAGRTTPTGYLLEVRPVSEDRRTRVYVHLDRQAQVVRRDYECGVVRWREVFEPAHKLTSRGFEWVLADETSEEIPDPPAQLFQLTLPTVEVGR